MKIIRRKTETECTPH